MKRVYSSMRRFCPQGFQVIHDEESESDADMESSSEESKNSTTEPEEIKEEVKDSLKSEVSPAPESTTQVENEEEKEPPFSKRDDQISMDLEWLSIVKITHPLMPIGKGRFNFDEYVHPLQEGHHKLILEKEEVYKELKDKNLDLNIPKLKNESLYTQWDAEK